MNPIRTIRRLACIVGGLAAAALAIAVGAPAAFAAPRPDLGGGPGSPAPVRVHTVLTASMPGWQITLIAIGAALAAATFAVLLDRTVTSRRQVTPAAP
jgi:hypothetical protein